MNLFEDMPREDPLVEEDVTCCYRMTFLPARLRNIRMTEPVFPRLSKIFTWQSIFWLGNIAISFALGWAVLYCLLGNTMFPYGDGFGLYTIAILSYSLGWSLSYLPYLHLPPVFGMLLAGLIIRNSGLYNIHEDLGTIATSKIRTFCLTFIMIRCGLQVSMTSLKRYTVFMMLLAVIPCTVELVILGICCRTILGYPWDWSFMVGAILACMSPVVTLNCVLTLAEKGYGEDKGLASVLSTAACLDDVHIISVFVLCFSIVFGNGETQREWYVYIPVGLRDFVLSVLAGFVLGVCCVFFPHRSHRYATWNRMIGLVLGSLLCTTATANLAVSGGGFLAVVVLAFTAITGWRMLSSSFQARVRSRDEIDVCLRFFFYRSDVCSQSEPFRQIAQIFWHVAQPMCVGVIGADIDLRTWTVDRFWLHTLCIMTGLIVRSSDLSARTALILHVKQARSIATYAVATLEKSLNWRERLFVVMCWLPKGTLQAALGPMAYERLREKPDHEDVQMALEVMRISVITVLFLAPVGTIAIMATGPLLLNQTAVEEDELDYLRRISLTHPHSADEKKGRFQLTGGRN
ncbi:sodium/hydrogen exchanger 9B1 [Megalopta genalis]|uniref:sodium/hydrogen exchanger 9B1 n=1 Tax=Megalopta genalis TaxID=115081 RepID=UPI003FD2E2CE